MAPPPKTPPDVGRAFDRRWLQYATGSLLVAFGTAVGAGLAGYSGIATSGLLWSLIAALGFASAMIAALLSRTSAGRADLARSEELYRILVEDNPALILRFDAAGRVTFANDTSCTFNKLTLDEMGERSICELVRGPRAESLRGELRRILSGPGPYAILAPFDDGDGQTRWLEWTARKLAGDDFHAVGIDVTGRHMAEQESRRLEQWLFQIQKQESLGLIAGGLAHDYNNLLTGILGHADLAAASLPADSPARPHLDCVIESAQRVADSNRQLLAFAGKGKLLEERIDLNRAIRAVAGEFEIDLPADCALELRLDNALPPVVGDENQLGQAIRNLLLNAFQSRVGRNVVVVITEALELDPDDFVDSVTGKAIAPGYTVRVTVSDSGSGIDDATLGRIFDPFFTTKTLGRGLGLPAVHGIVAAHGGAIRVDSEPDRGTTVRFALPAAPALETVPEVELAVLDRRLALGRRRAVLIVDDEDSVRMLLAQMILKLGWEVLSAESGPRGIEAFRGNTERVAFVVLDLTMPDMDGLAVRAALRAIRPGTPILFCTGYSREAITTDDASGPTGLLLKPFVLADLETAIADLLALPGVAPAR